MSQTTALVIGATGGIGSALVGVLTSSNQHASVVGLSRSSTPAIDLRDEASIVAATRSLADADLDLRLIIVATGLLHDDTHGPEKALRQLDADHMRRSFEVNAIGPALLLKHLVPLLPRKGRSVFAALSARVGGISDNQLGGWHSYRASKAALNQIIRTASIELRRTHPEAVCLAVHPGTVDTKLSHGFQKTDLAVSTPAVAARDLVAMLSTIDAGKTGLFVDRFGAPIAW